MRFSTTSTVSQTINQPWAGVLKGYLLEMRHSRASEDLERAINSASTYLVPKRPIGIV